MFSILNILLRHNKVQNLDLLLRDIFTSAVKDLNNVGKLESIYILYIM